MAKTTNTFGRYLHQFALSSDIIDGPTLKEIGALITSYVRDELNIDYFRMLREGVHDDQRALVTLWSSHGDTGSKSIFKREDGDDGGGGATYKDQTAYAFDQGRALWMVAFRDGDSIPLRDATEDECEDQWNSDHPLPPTPTLPMYRPPRVRDLPPRRTSIIVPVCKTESVCEGDKPIGVLFLESPDYLQITPVAKEEFRLLARTVAILLQRNEATESWTLDTVQAVSDLRALLETETLQRMTVPHVFFAYPEAGDRDVINSVKEVLSKYADRVAYEDWEAKTETGKIDEQLEKDLVKSRFGVCYLSTPNLTDDDPPQFRDPAYLDNSNVMFEAGMLHALTLRVTETGAGWIPVREKRSPKRPFDVQAQRMIEVPRADDGTFDKDAFSAVLEACLDTLLGEQP